MAQRVSRKAPRMEKKNAAMESCPCPYTCHKPAMSNLGVGMLTEKFSVSSVPASASSVVYCGFFTAEVTEVSTEVTQLIAFSTASG